ncbi:uncharacterized protein LOC110465616 [Mizuhopecten yessoensis]|uniref:Uncharacterized protein n=1 Tax=Mizuhopecten yessoensis TaxID=6573 RepID=A0A210PR93_MIZYE|nr:uncharacterized protein LOC110465616 [Mizuhopecten yessoensis]OWF39010.1 hypothetical protein KP79_PYT05320 [Mizuhopecten yessoensis]
MAAGKVDNNQTSDTGSNVDMPAVHGLIKNARVPEQWTLPHEWNMEKREMFENWKMDVQNQVANIATNLERSLKEYPNPDAGKKFDYTDEIEKAEMEKERRIYARFTGDTLNYGLQRLPSRAIPDKY